jgi:membrane fusion protein (multidrug efflux system)
MADEPTNSELDSGSGTSPSKGIPKWLLWGGGIAAAGAVAVTAINNGGADIWSNSEAEKAAAIVDVDEKVEPKKEETKVEPQIRGVIKAKQESTIASKMTARIVNMPFKKGQSFRRGALLASFDCSTITAQLRAAQAATTAYKKTYETNVELDQYEAVGKNEVAVSKANLGKAAAEAGAVRAQLSDCAVYAPFSGTVVEQIAHRGEIAASGQPLLKIQSGGDLEVELIVPSNWLTWVRPGATFSYLIDETGATITGAVTSLGASVDPVSKTIRVTGSVGGSDSLILPGMSGTAKFDNPGAMPAVPETAVAPPTVEKAKVDVRAKN